MTFDDQLKALIFFHLQEHTSAQHLLQVLEEDDFAHNNIAPEEGIKKSSFAEAINNRGLEQRSHIYQNLQAQAISDLPKEHDELGDLISIDGSLIDACLSMQWADYRKGSKKAKVHLGFDINHGIPRKVFLTDGKGPERPFVSMILSPGQTGVLDRGYQAHDLFDLWQEEGKHFLCRIKGKTKKKCIERKDINPYSNIFYDAIVLLGTPEINQTKKPIRLVGYIVDGIKYWVANDMKCPNCKNKTVCTSGDYHYTESGLDNVYLLGIEIYHCSCGEEIISLPAVNELHTLIALNLIKQRHTLNGKELRFLRKNLGLTAKKLGQIIGIDNSTISRWEKDSQSISSTHDRLLRLLYLNMKGISQEEIKSVIQEDFTAISSEQLETPPFMIPRERWSKTEICFSEGT